jgi:hypothetical protein
MLYAMIRHDADAAWSVDETARAGRLLTAALSKVEGFVSCALVDTGDGGLVSIAICEDTAGLDAARRLLEGWLEAHLAPSTHHLTTTVAGDVIVQCGL